jgi:hypothetical protein
MMLTADDLVEEGKRLNRIGKLVVFLHPSQEWMAVHVQMPFLRYSRIPVSAKQVTVYKQAMGGTDV